MTTITIERAFLIKVLNQIDIAQSLLERSQHHAKMAAVYEELRAALAAPATAPEELERLRQIAHLIGTIFCYGHFVAETHNERVLEKLLRENGTFWESVEQYEREQGRM